MTRIGDLKPSNRERGPLLEDRGLTCGAKLEDHFLHLLELVIEEDGTSR